MLELWVNPTYQELVSDMKDRIIKNQMKRSSYPEYDNGFNAGMLEQISYVERIAKSIRKEGD